MYKVFDMKNSEQERQNNANATSPLKVEGSVQAWHEDVTIPTYEIGKAEKNPIFLEKRVYQGSSGVVYPYPVVEKIEDEKQMALEEETLMPQVDVSLDSLVPSGEIDSLDDLNENLLKKAFGEEVMEEEHVPMVAPEEQGEKIEVIRGEIESSIARSITGLAQSDILREALKGMRINISITFDEKE